MRIRRDEPMSAEAERELEALDRALAGDDVEAEFAELAALATDLQAERPVPDRDWGLGLDLQAENGFGRAGKPPWRRALGDRRPMSLLAPAGALATLAVVAAVGISVSRDSAGTGDDAGAPSIAAQSETVAPESSASGDQDAGGLSAELGELEDGDTAGKALDRLDFRASRASGEASNISGAVAAQPGLAANGAYLRLNASRDSGKLAPGQDKRIEDRSASLVLQTETPKVREVSDRAISIVQGAGGIIVSSNLSEQGKRASATLELSIPTRALDSTLDQLTELATVKSLNEGSVDITRPFVSAEDALKDAKAERKELLEALGNATTDFEAEAIRKQLDDVQGEIARAEATFQNVARRARLADVSLQIEGKPESDDGSWSLGEAADDALDVLRTVAGVLLISAAILVPLGLIVAAVTGVVLWIRRRRRERALDD